MSEIAQKWQIESKIDLPEWFLEVINHYAPDLPGHYAAQLLAQRGIQDRQQLEGFLNSELYQPASPFAFGQEMEWAVKRLQTAYEIGEKVAIWGDFDADGVTATSVLWDGLGQFFHQNTQLIYYIPNRITESHGLNNSGIDNLVKQGCSLIVTCDTGSTSLSEIEYAHRLGIDIIVTDHHTLPDQRPSVVAIINPRYLPTDHQLYHLAGVAVAYKLVEALYEIMPDIPQESVENLLDLVAIGLIADLVKLTGDCRYLAQKGIAKLQEDFKKLPTMRQRPGVGKLLELARRNGDRPTDISFGIGPRINAVSRIYGNAAFCVELLTSPHLQLAEKLALETELANTRRKSLQKDVAQQALAQLKQLDLSTTSVIVLQEIEWSVGVLGLVAGQIAQEYGRPTILLSIENTASESGQLLARGSARSVSQIDLYQLVKTQAHLLHRFGGHPFAAGLSLPVENINLFTEALNRQLRQQIGMDSVNLAMIVKADLVCTVQELGQDLFRELKLLEPCGMGNPVPKILLQNCWFEKCWHQKDQDLTGKKVDYIKSDFMIRDDSTNKGFPGLWWGHYKDEIPSGRCDAIVELDYNTYKNRHEVRLITVRQCSLTSVGSSPQLDWIIDGRTMTEVEKNFPDDLIIIEECPTSWDELQVWFRQAIHQQKKIAIAFAPPKLVPPSEIGKQLVGLAKYLSRTGTKATRYQLLQKLGISDRTLELGFQILKSLGFHISFQDRRFRFQVNLTKNNSEQNSDLAELEKQFSLAIIEEQFRRQYFYQVDLETIQAIATRTTFNENLSTLADLPF